MEGNTSLMLLWIFVENIVCQFTNPYTLEKNIMSERKNYTLFESAKFMLQTAKLPNFL